MSTVHPTSPGRRCVFCGGEGVTLEHVWADWIGRLMAQRLTITEVVLVRDAVQMKRPRIDAQVKRVCATCNNGWMSVMEAEAKPLLIPMMMGEGLPLSRSQDELRVLARWALKTYLMIDFYFPKHQRALPARFYSEFFRHKYPPQQCAIWIAAYRGQNFGFGVQAGKVAHATPPVYTPHGILVAGRAGPLAVMCTLTLHHLIFQVILVDAGFPIGNATGHPGAQLIWPLPRESIQWPLRMEGLDDAEVEIFARRSITIFGRTPS